MASPYWKPIFQTLYEVYYQELASQALTRRWEQIHIYTAFLGGITASGSFIAGLAFWSEPGWKIAWTTIACIASLLSIAHAVFAVPGRIREQEQVRHLFLNLRLDVETSVRLLKEQLIDDNKAKEFHDQFRERFRDTVARTRQDIAFTASLQAKAADQLNGILKQRGYIE